MPVLLLLGAALLLVTARAQFAGGRAIRGRFGDFVSDPEAQREQAEIDASLKPGFKDDTFTFARLRYENVDYGRGFRAWDDDSPQADWNVAYRLFQVTSVKVRPGLNDIPVTSEALGKYPFVYAAAGGRMDLEESEASALRQYLLNGGFLMIDDFWGDSQWEHCYRQMKRIFPDREPEEITIDHPIFHTVFSFRTAPQIPSVNDFFSTGQSYDSRYDYQEHGHQPHYYAIYDGKHRMMVLICHNNHYGDGWEHESQNEDYFDKFSEPMGYPMLINIVYYVTTH